MKATWFASLWCIWSAFAAPNVIHKVTPTYPPAAKLRGVEGVVTVEADIDARGLVVDARVLTGPRELRRAALEAVFDWQFAPAGSDVRTTVDLNFRLEPDTAPPIGTLKGIELRGLAPDLETRVRARIPLDAGDTLRSGALDIIRGALAEIEPPVSANLTADNVLRVAPAPTRLRIGGNVQATKIRKKVAPIYPAEARQQRIQGTVRLEATIDRDGNIYRLHLVNGHPLLTAAAIPAVSQWQYERTLLNGDPVEVITMIDVNFTLAP